jgi:hypothetical protein
MIVDNYRYLTYFNHRPGKHWMRYRGLANYKFGLPAVTNQLMDRGNGVGVLNVSSEQAIN